MINSAEAVQQIRSKRTIKITNSYGTRDYYYYYKTKRKSKLKETTFRKIFTAVITEIANEYLFQYLRVKLPYQMGELFVIKKQAKVTLQADGTYKSTRKVNWAATLKLWSEDQEAFDQRIMVRSETSCIHILLYWAMHRSYKKHTLFKLQINRTLNAMIHERMTNNNNYKLWQSNTLL